MENLILSPRVNRRREGGEEREEREREGQGGHFTQFLMAFTFFISRIHLSQADVLLATVASGNVALNERIRFKAILGFVRFSYCYYMVVVTRTRQLGSIGPHNVFVIDSTEMIPIVNSDFEKDPEYRRIKAQELRSDT
jgi:hypothetical protein